MEPLTPERRRQQTRDYLLGAAAQVFAKRGFHGATLDEVAAVAGFTKGAVYSNFKNKADLFLALFEANYQREMAALVTVVEDHAELPAGAALSDFVALIREQVRQSGPEFGLLLQEFWLYAARDEDARRQLAQLEEFYARAVGDLLENERRRRGLPPLANPERTARVLNAMFHGINQLRCIDPDAVDDALIEEAINFVARALGADLDNEAASAERPAASPAGPERQARAMPAKRV
jgi:AcrR family transcriptional regulator